MDDKTREEATHISSQGPDPSDAKRLFPLSLLTWHMAIALTCCYLAIRLAMMGPTPASTQIQVVCLAAETVAFFPFSLIWCNAFVILVNRRRMHPYVSTFALLGLTGLSVDWLGRSAMGLWMNWAQPEYLTFLAVYEVHSCVSLLLKAGCWWLLVVAVLGWRENC